MEHLKLLSLELRHVDADLVLCYRTYFNLFNIQSTEETCQDSPGLRLLAQDSELADKYNVTISNAFAALGHHSQDPESARKQVRDTIVTTAIAVVPVRRSKHRPWLKTETLDIIDQKRDARLTGKRDEHRQLKGIYRAKAKADLDEFYNALADEAETGFRQNNLQPAFSSIK